MKYYHTIFEKDEQNYYCRLWLNDWAAPRFSPHDNPAAFLPSPLLRVS